MWIFMLIIVLLLIGVVFYVFFMKEISNQKETTTKSKQRISSKKGNETFSEKQIHKANRKGELGEYKINLQLGQLSKDFKYIDDILIRTSKGLAQIDHVLITPVGLFVIETKNYMGKIYGSPTYNSWTQYINGSKTSFYNPIKQNAGHIQALKTLLKSYNNIEYHSVISFSKRCELRIDLDLRTPQSEPMVVYDTNLSDLILKKHHILKTAKDKQLLSSDEITRIYDFITISNITGSDIRQEHIEEVKKKKLY